MEYEMQPSPQTYILDSNSKTPLYCKEEAPWHSISLPFTVPSDLGGPVTT